MSIFFLCVDLPHQWVHPRFAEQISIRSIYSFFPGSQLRNSAIVGCAKWNDHAKSEVQWMELRSTACANHEWPWRVLVMGSTTTTTSSNGIRFFLDRGPTNWNKYISVTTVSSPEALTMTFWDNTDAVRWCNWSKRFMIHTVHFHQRETPSVKKPKSCMIGMWMEWQCVASIGQRVWDGSGLQVTHVQRTTKTIPVQDTALDKKELLHKPDASRHQKTCTFFNVPTHQNWPGSRAPLSKTESARHKLLRRKKTVQRVRPHCDCHISVVLMCDDVLGGTLPVDLPSADTFRMPEASMLKQMNEVMSGSSAPSVVDVVVVSWACGPWRPGKKQGTRDTINRTCGTRIRSWWKTCTTLTSLFHDLWHGDVDSLLHGALLHPLHDGLF